MFRIAIRDVLISAAALGLAIGWWLHRQAKQAESTDQQPETAARGLDRHPSIAAVGNRRDYERFSRFRLN